MEQNLKPDADNHVAVPLVLFNRLAACYWGKAPRAWERTGPGVQETPADNLPPKPAPKVPATPINPPQPIGMTMAVVPFTDFSKELLNGSVPTKPAQGQHEAGKGSKAARRP